jgi:hypothetical protein
MPADLKTCRQHASRCAELAHSARSPELKMTLIDLSKNWMKLAVQLERNHVLLEIDDPPPLAPRKNPS